VVIDYSKNGDDQSAFTTEEINLLQASGKIVLAYLSIGEAESYRFYWKTEWDTKKPNFIEQENPDWNGNYKVKYWYRSWWEKALKPYLDRILKAGFDGVYLDIIDGYYYFGTKDNRLEERAHSDGRISRKDTKYTRDRFGEELLYSLKR